MNDLWNDAGELDLEDSALRVPCPSCDREILEDLPRCPYCESNVWPEDAPASGQLWLLLLGAACLFAAWQLVAGQ
jgi:hypothetical protein